MHCVKVTTLGIVALAVLAGACNRDVSESAATTAREDAANADRKADLQRERDEEISGLEKRVAEMEREYLEANAKVASGEREGHGRVARRIERGRGQRQDGCQRPQDDDTRELVAAA